MSSTAVGSIGTTIWLAALATEGWELSVHVEVIPGRRVVVHQQEDDFEPLELLAPERHVYGVRATKGDGREFVPCGSERDAWALLKRVLSETED